MQGSLEYPACRNKIRIKFKEKKQHSTAPIVGTDDDNVTPTNHISSIKNTVTILTARKSTSVNPEQYRLQVRRFLAILREERGVDVEEQAVVAPVSSLSARRAVAEGVYGGRAAEDFGVGELFEWVSKWDTEESEG